MPSYLWWTPWKALCGTIFRRVRWNVFGAIPPAARPPSPCARSTLGWLPDRLVTVTYLGQNRFVVEESLNSSLQPGDSFECLQIQTGRPLYLDRFRRNGSLSESRYVAGEPHGLTTVKEL